MKLSMILTAAGAVSTVLAIWQQPTVPAALKPHVSALQDAKSLTAKLTVTPVGGSAEEIKLSFSKPNHWKVESAKGFRLYDGTNIYVYDAAKKTYTETPASPEAATASLVADPTTWAWAAFFSGEPFNGVSAAQRGKTQKIRGLDLTAASLSFSKTGRTATFYLDDKAGVVRGLSYKDTDHDFIAIAAELTLGKEPLAESLFAFVAPEGAMKQEAEVQAEGAVHYKDVQALLTKNCMPCHNSQNKRGRYDLSSYEGVMGSSGAVNVENPDDSFIIRSLRGDRAQKMPKGKAPLSSDQIQAIYDWMKAGAKND